jgi:tripartite motif-containing protein 71
VNSAKHRSSSRAARIRPAHPAALAALALMLAAASARGDAGGAAAGPAASGAAADRASGVGRSCVVGLRPLGEVPGADAWRLESPRALAVDHRGDVLIADTGNDRVLTVSRSGETVREFGGFGWGDGEFDSPSDLAVYPGFYVYVLDEGNRRVELFDADGDFVEVVVAEDEAGSPVSIAVGQAGEILLVDADSQAVLARSQFDEVLAPIGRFGSGAGGLARPRGVAWGPGRRIAVADAGRNAVVVFDEFGSALYSLSSPDTLDPGDLVFDPSGSLIVSDLRHGGVLAFPPDGGPPSASFDGAGSLSPTALALDQDGRLLVLDGERGRILLVEMAHGKCPRDR